MVTFFYFRNLMKLSFVEYTLQLKHEFSISYSSRKTTPAVIVKIEDDGCEGFGEASLPPYLTDTQKSVTDYLSKIILRNVNSIEDIHANMDELERLNKSAKPAKAAINIALNDLLGKKYKIPIFRLYNIKMTKTDVPTSFTIGIDTKGILKKKIIEAEEYDILKIKLGSDNDKEIINEIRKVTQKPLFVDANQGWKNKHQALNMILWLEDKNVKLIEQPMPVAAVKEAQWLKEKSPLPLIADEAVRVYEDIEKIKNCFHGVNIKLMKCGGINEALRMINSARKNNMKIMLGCMTETSCAISAAAQLLSYADFIDLDGNQLISNDPFESKHFKNGKFFLSEEPGLGIKLKKNLFVD